MHCQEGRLFETDDDPEFGNVLQRLRKGKVDLSHSRKMHLCSHELCNPESEEQLMRKNQLSGPLLSNNVYICIFGVIHVCSATSCQLYGASHNQTCHISGIQHGTLESSYDKNDSRTWYSKPSTNSQANKRVRQETQLDVVSVKESVAPKKAKKQMTHTVLSEEAVKTKASEVVTKLLFSSCRTRRNQDAIIGFKREAMKAKHTYILQRHKTRQLPYLTDIYRLMGHFTSQALPLLEFEYDESLHNYYVNVIHQIWMLALKYYVPPDQKEYDEEGVEIVPRLDIMDVSLGTLYLMRQGLVRDGVVLLPRDEFLLVSLPLIHEMSYFEINKKKITKGNSIIMDMYNNAIAAGALPEELALDVRKLPEKNVPTTFRKLGGVQESN